MGLLPHDLLVTVADAVVSSSFWVSTRLRKPPVPAVVERTIRLRVADRQVVAHDQDVVALTFVSADGAGQGVLGERMRTALDEVSRAVDGGAAAAVLDRWVQASAS